MNERTENRTSGALARTRCVPHEVEAARKLIAARSSERDEALDTVVERILDQFGIDRPTCRPIVRRHGARLVRAPRAPACTQR